MLQKVELTAVQKAVAESRTSNELRLKLVADNKAAATAILLKIAEKYTDSDVTIIVGKTIICE